MPQTFQVLRCYKCLVFQVHQTKKSIKWECKLCGEKQSIKRHYGIGTGKDCRIHVQKLNSIRGEIDELKCSQMQRNQDSEEGEELSEGESVEPQKTVFQSSMVKDSKWSNYIEETLEEPSNEPMHLGDAEVVLEIPKKRRKPFQNLSRSNKYAKVGNNVDHTTMRKLNDKRNIQELSNYESRGGVDIISSEPLQSDTISISLNIEKVNYSKPIISRKFVPSVSKKNSKWANYAEDQETEIKDSLREDTSQIPALNSAQSISITQPLQPKIQSNDENYEPRKKITKFVPPILNKNSKWAQFADEDQPDITCSPSMDASQNNLFSLCDDSELDNVLDL